MEDANRKAMFASKKLHRIKNLPALDNSHYLVNPSDVRNSLMLRNAQKLSAKTSEQRNRAYLKEQRYNNAWENDKGLYFQDPRYEEIEEKIRELGSMNLLDKDYDQYIANKPKVAELKEQQRKIEADYDQKRHDRKKIQKSSAIGFSVLHRNAVKNQIDLEKLIDESKWYEVDDDIRDKLTKKKPKGFDPTQVPNFKNDMWYKLHDKQKSSEKPIRDEIDMMSEKINKLDKEHDSLSHLDVDNPKRKKAFDAVQNERHKQIALYDKLSKSHERFNEIHDSVHGHIKHFKR